VSGAHDAIRRVVEEYAAAADRVDGEAIAALFTPDGVLEIWMDPTGQSSSAVRRGRAEIATAMTRLSTYRATQHAIANHSATVDPGVDRARAETRCAAHHLEEVDGKVQDRVLFIRYDDDLVAVDGDWLIARRELHVQWVTVQPVEAG